MKIKTLIAGGLGSACLATAPASLAFPAPRAADATPLPPVSVERSAYVQRSSNDVVFSCVTTSGKRLAVIDNGPSVAYSYGRDDSPPDLAFSVPRASVTRSDSSRTTDNGVIYDSLMTLDIQRGLTLYSLTANYVDDQARPTHSYHIRVFHDGKMLADTYCAGSVVDRIPNATFEFAN